MISENARNKKLGDIQSYTSDGSFFKADVQLCFVNEIGLIKKI